MLHFCTILHVGEFGIVYRSLMTLKSDEVPKVVAIKTLKGIIIIPYNILPFIYTYRTFFKE